MGLTFFYALCSHICRMVVSMNKSLVKKAEQDYNQQELRELLMRVVSGELPANAYLHIASA